ncbi:MAG: diguanylate cyclase [Anaerolineales bacterium]|nr:diguanylate cyclase [Anaerolineales bacterium]MDW8162697.1 diguanylate cyclase [Anaerolineales bacterium]
MAKPIVLLLVEDDPNHAELLRRSLAGHSRPFELIWVDTIAAAQRWLGQNTPDLLLTDLYLPDGSGRAFLQNHSKPLPYPVIVQTAFGDEQKAVEVIKAGAFDYLPKRFDLFRELPYLLERALEEWRHQRERQEMEARLQTGESVFRAIFENAPVGVLYFDEKGVVQAANSSLARMLSLPRESLVGLELLHVPYEPIVVSIQRVLAGEKVSWEVDFRSRPYQPGLAVRAQLSPVQLPDGKVIGGVAILEEITAERDDRDLHQALYEIADLANRAEDAATLYAGIHQIVRRILPAENFYIALWDKRTKRLCFPYWVDQHEPNPGTVPLAKGLTEYVLQSGRTLLAENELCEQMEKRGEIERIAAPSAGWLGVPLKDRSGAVFGAVVVQSYDPRVRYNLHQAGIMEYIAAQIAQVLQRFQAEEEERRQRQIAEALLEATAAFSQSLDLERVFERILAQLDHLSPYTHCSLWLIEGKWAQVVAEAGRPLPKTEEAHKLSWQELDTLWQIYSTKLPLFIIDTQAYPHWHLIPGLEWVRTYLGLPLSVKGSVIGFLNLGFETVVEIDPADIGPLEAFANLAAQAIENARLYRQAQELAIHDELTCIYNRRGLKILAWREFERAVRYQRPLSVLFADVDDFKAFNDRYSYTLGDRVLKEIAQCLVSHLREIDLPARFGGDEFVVVLPETSREEAIRVVRRLNSLIRQIALDHEGKPLSISVTFGLAERLESDSSWEELLERAANSLRRAKREGVPLFVV